MTPEPIIFTPLLEKLHLGPSRCLAMELELKHQLQQVQIIIIRSTFNRAIIH